MQCGGCSCRRRPRARGRRGVRPRPIPGCGVSAGTREACRHRGRSWPDLRQLVDHGGAGNGSEVAGAVRPFVEGVQPEMIPRNDVASVETFQWTALGVVGSRRRRDPGAIEPDATAIDGNDILREREDPLDGCCVAGSTQAQPSPELIPGDRLEIATLDSLSSERSRQADMYQLASTNLVEMRWRPPIEARTDRVTGRPDAVVAVQPQDRGQAGRTKVEECPYEPGSSPATSPIGF